MAVPTFVSAGSVADDLTGGASYTPTPPTHQTNDILICASFNAGGDTPVTATGGWTQIATIVGTMDSSWYWKRATAAGTAGPTMTASNTDCFSIVYAIRGCVESGTPYEGAATSGDGTNQETTPDTAQVITLGNDRLVMCFVGHDGESAGVTWSSGNPPSGWSISNNTDSTDGTDVGFYCIQQSVLFPATIPTAVVGTMSAATQIGCLTLAFIPNTNITWNNYEFAKSVSTGIISVTEKIR